MSDDKHDPVGEYSEPVLRVSERTDHGHVLASSRILDVRQPVPSPVSPARRFSDYENNH